MSSTKEIRRRIGSIKNTGKITRAMEMVSAAKMRKSVESVIKVREYAHSAWSILANLSRTFDRHDHKLLETREVKGVLMVVIASNRGLCGSYNSQTLRKIKAEIENPENLKVNKVGDKRIDSTVSNADLKIDFVTVGRKGDEIVRKLKKEIIASFADLTYLPKSEDVRPLAKLVTDEYLAGNYDKVVIAYTDYISTISQKTKIRQLLPISRTDLEKQISDMDGVAKDDGVKEPKFEYKVEPNPSEVLDNILPRLLEMQIFHAIVESNASKESARMIAMRNATEAAGEMADDLTFVYNQIRQSKITQEIAEISAGRAALE
ncbi:F0F1 ATP synthase subunit gamma [Patescibacteria group bacterium]